MAQFWYKRRPILIKPQICVRLATCFTVLCVILLYQSITVKNKLDLVAAALERGKLSLELSEVTAEVANSGSKLCTKLSFKEIPGSSLNKIPGSSLNKIPGSSLNKIPRSLKESPWSSITRSPESIDNIDEILPSSNETELSLKDEIVPSDLDGSSLSSLTERPVSSITGSPESGLKEIIP